MRRALIVSGEGIGNVIQSTAAIAVFQDIFRGSLELDVLLPGHQAWVPLIEGSVRVFTKPDPTQDYAYIIPSWLLHPYTMKMSAVRRGSSKVVPGGDPLKLNTSESEAHVRAVLEVARIEGMDLASPPRIRTWCNHTVPHKLNPYIEGKGPRICLHDGGNPVRFWKAKRYPFWQSVYEIINAEIPEATFLVLGTARDGNISGKNVVDMRKTCSLLETAGILREADLFMGNDTGLAHVAAALGTSACIVFGPTNITKNLPPHNAFPIHETNGLACRPCQRLGGTWRRGVDGRRCHIECLHTLPAGDVADRIVDALRKKSIT